MKGGGIKKRKRTKSQKGGFLALLAAHHINKYVRKKQRGGLVIPDRYGRGKKQEGGFIFPFPKGARYKPFGIG